MVVKAIGGLESPGNLLELQTFTWERSGTHAILILALGRERLKCQSKAKASLVKVVSSRLGGGNAQL